MCLASKQMLSMRSMRCIALRQVAWQGTLHIQVHAVYSFAKECNAVLGLLAVHWFVLDAMQCVVMHFNA